MKISLFNVEGVINSSEYSKIREVFDNLWRKDAESYPEDLLTCGVDEYKLFPITKEDEVLCDSIFKTIAHKEIPWENKDQYYAPGFGEIRVIRQSI